MQSKRNAGAHDFDFNLGTWHTHIQRVLDPFADQEQRIELDGTVSVRKIWGGRARLEEIGANGPKGHWEALTLFLYNPKVATVEPDFHQCETRCSRDEIEDHCHRVFLDTTGKDNCRSTPGYVPLGKAIPKGSERRCAPSGSVPRG
jgi:hypothetical protein